MANRGEAADYYNGAPAPNNYYQMRDGEPKQGQPPPNYGQTYAPPPGPPINGNQQAYGTGTPRYNEKPSFEQAFAIPKPKYNDWWAGILFIAVFLGYTAVSGIAIQGYCMLRRVALLGYN
jgi:hypothetical protein